MSSLTILLPALAQIREANSSPTLAGWISRGDGLEPSKPGRDSILRACFEFIGKTIPYAALTRSLDATDCTGNWLRADPAYVVADAVTLRMLACGELGLKQGECDELTKPLRLLFGDAGFPLEASTPQRWYLRCPTATPLPAFSTPRDVLGDDLGRHLPHGENERQWRHLLNEAQVILHNHTLNAQRIQRGQLPANSVWFWGPGSLPDWVRTKFSHVQSGDDAVIALSRLAKVPSEAPSGQIEPDSKNTLLDLAAVRDAAELDQTFLVPIHAALRRRELDEVILLLEDGSRHRVTRAHRWRFWRRTKSLRAP